MKIIVRSTSRQRRGVARVDLSPPPDRAPLKVRPNAPIDNADAAEAVCELDWSKALDAQGRLVGCPVCRCRELFTARRALPQRMGLGVTIVAGLVSVGLFAWRQTVAAYLVLAGVVIVDAVLALFTPRSLVCYRCRSEFHHAPLPDPAPAYDLATDEKYSPAWSTSQESA